MFTFQRGLREVFNCYRCRSEYSHIEQGNLSDLQEKMHEADGAKGGKMHAISSEGTSGLSTAPDCLRKWREKFLTNHRP